MTLEEAQKQVDQWVKTYGVRYFSELTNMAVLTEEVGELARVMARKYGDQSFKEGEKDNIDEEIADVLWVLLCIANQTGVDITTAFQKSMDKKTKRDNKRHINNPKLTTLNSTDSDKSVMHFTEKVNQFDDEYPDLKNVAAICVYPNFAAIVKNTLEVDGVNIACVSGGFPSSQTFIEVKVAETALAIAEGADEIDIVISIGKFLSGDYEGMCEEIQELKEVCKERHLKVILETGALKSASNIKKASILSMYSGADFIKTSTGKQQPAATPEAAYVMCEAIKEYHQKTGIKIGFKPAGGINTVNDAIIYYTIVKELLGEEWLDNQLFRLGTSRLANLLLSDIKGEEIKFF